MNQIGIDISNNVFDATLQQGDRVVRLYHVAGPIDFLDEE